MHHIDDRLVLSYVKDEIDRVTDATALHRWMRDAEAERQRVIDNEAEPNRDSRIEMLGSEMHYLQQRIYQLKKNMKQTFKTIAKAVAYTAAGIAIWAIWILIMLIADAEGVML